MTKQEQYDMIDSTLETFSNLMRKRLRSKVDENPDGWRDAKLSDLIDRLALAAVHLETMPKENMADLPRVITTAVDAANYAMMIEDHQVRKLVGKI